MQSADFKAANPLVGGLPGAVKYEATCKCQFNRNYPYAFGPRLALAYQIGSDGKTVLRLGTGIVYGTAPNNAFLSTSLAVFYTLGVPGYGLNKYSLSDGNPFADGNRFGNPTVSFPDFSQKYPFEIAPGLRPPPIAVHLDRPQRRTSSSANTLEHRHTARNHAIYDAGCLLRRKPGRLVDGATDGKRKLQRLHTGEPEG